MSNLYPDIGVEGLVHGLHLNINNEEFPSPPSPLPELSEEETMKEIRASTPQYDNKLYNLQMSAPKPNPIKNYYEDDDKPHYYGDEYHGRIERVHVARVLGKTDGNYIVRESVTQPGKYSLSFVFGGQIKHYLLDYKNGKHVIGQKEFESMNLLVSDGLISLHVQKEGAEHITKCITMKRNIKRPAPPPPVTKKEVQTENDDDDYAQVDEVEEDGLRPACLKPAERNKNTRQTVRVSSFYESDAQTFEKKHVFKIHTYFGFPFCDYCSNYLWGLTQQGFQCQDCGMNVHHQCKNEVPDDCKPSKKRITKVFGVDLTTVVKVKDVDNIPPVLHKAISIIESSGLKTEGIYRVNGSLDEVNRFKDLIDNNSSTEVLNKADLFVVCSLLKQFLRELPMPVITYDAYQAFIDANKFQDHEERVGETKKAIRLLPHSHFHTLKALIEHLSRVSTCSDQNQMTTDNLSIVFGPTIFRSPDMSPANMMTDLNHQKVAVKFMIDHCWRLLR